MRIYDTGFGGRFVDVFFHKQGLEQLLSFIKCLDEAVLELRIFDEEMFEKFFAVIISSGADELLCKILS